MRFQRAGSSELRGVVLDIDGTLLRGNRALPGAADLLAELRRRGLRVVLLTNDSQETPRAWVERLERLGIDLAPGEVITAAELAAEVTARRFPDATILAIGDAALTDALRARGLRVMEDPAAAQADVVVMGMDSAFDQRRLLVACRQLWGGAAFIATNDDRRRPADGGHVPGAGAMVKAVAWSSGVEPMVVGKPAATAALAALDRLGLPAADALMVGDQPGTDIAMGKGVGMATALASLEADTTVDTGSLPPAHRPDVVLSRLMDLITWIDEGRP